MSSGKYVPFARYGAVTVLIVALLMQVATIQPVAARPSDKTFAIVGTVDCGMASGRACTIGDTIRVWTRDLSGNLELITIDVGWIKKQLDSYDQDDIIYLEVEDVPGGGYRGLSTFTPDPKRKSSKGEDPVTVLPGSASPTPQTRILTIDDVDVAEPEGQGFTRPSRLMLKGQPSIQFGTAEFTVTLSSPSASTVTVEYTTEDVTAVGGPNCDTQNPPDYENTSGTLTFDPGETEQAIEVTICADFNFSEDGETFHVVLSNPQGAGFGDPLGVGTIVEAPR